MKRDFLVAGINIQICHLNIDKVWDKFLAKVNTDKDISISLLSLEKESYNIEKYCITKDTIYGFRYKTSMMFVNEEWTNFSILADSTDAIDTFLIQAFYTQAVMHGLIQIHSSMINFQAKGLLFLGPSGIGKTTMSELWNKYRNALIINGDMNFVQEMDNFFLGWGTPWHGSSPYCENTSVPIHAMIVLKQAPENSIRELTGFEKVTAVSDNVFYPLWLENGMELCLETLDHLLTNIPVYELSCRPDEDAVRLTEETIFGKRMI